MTWSHRHLSIHHVPYLMSHSIPRHCSKTLSRRTKWASRSQMRIFRLSRVLHVRRLTHWVRMTHICASKKTIIGSDNGLSPPRHQAIISANAKLLLIGPLGIKFLIKIHTFWFKKMYFKMSAKWRPFCLSFNVLILPAIFINKLLLSTSKYIMTNNYDMHVIFKMDYSNRKN